jgi:hypothetical protein
MSDPPAPRKRPFYNTRHEGSVDSRLPDKPKWAWPDRDTYPPATIGDKCVVCQAPAIWSVPDTADPLRIVTTCEEHRPHRREP